MVSFVLKDDGALGRPTGVVNTPALFQGLEPDAFPARMRHLYFVAGCRPVTVAVVEVVWPLPIVLVKNSSYTSQSYQLAPVTLFQNSTASSEVGEADNEDGGDDGAGSGGARVVNEPSTHAPGCELGFLAATLTRQE